MPTKTRQVTIGEVDKSRNKTCCKKLDTYLKAKTARDAIAAEWRELDKAARDAKSELQDALPVESKVIRYRIGEHVMDRIPEGKSKSLSFKRRTKSRLMFVKEVQPEMD